MSYEHLKVAENFTVILGIIANISDIELLQVQVHY